VRVGPNVARYEARFGDGPWNAVQPQFTWRLSAGANTLAVRSVNAFDVPGRPARAVVETAGAD